MLKIYPFKLKITLQPSMEINYQGTRIPKADRLGATHAWGFLLVSELVKMFTQECGIIKSSQNTESGGLVIGYIINFIQ